MKAIIAIKVITDENVKIKFTSGLNPLTLSDNEGSEHLILPIRLVS